MEAVFDFFESEKAVKIIEASDVIMSVEVFEATEVFRTIPVSYTHLTLPTILLV